MFTSLVAKAERTGITYNTLDSYEAFRHRQYDGGSYWCLYFPEEMWWRAIGRITFPVWFFLGVIQAAVA